MIGIPLLDHEERPDWWHRFVEDIVRVQDRQHLPKWERYSSWIQDVNDKLMLHGGAIRRMKQGNHLLVTFRLDSNYTMFVLKYS
jgi:hypothetical protein